MPVVRLDDGVLVKIEVPGLSLVDVQPAYEGLALLKSDSLLQPFERIFLRAQLRRTIRDMKKTAKHLEQELKALTPESQL